MKIPPPDEWISLQEASRLLGCSYNTTLRIVSKGRKVENKTVFLESWRTGGRRVTTVRKCEEFLEEVNT